MALNRFRMRPGSKPERRDRIRSKSPDFSGKKVELVYAVFTHNQAARVNAALVGFSRFPPPMNERLH